jgi:hypothetical protein
MSEEQVMRRKCDYCGDVQEFDSKPLTPADGIRVAGWAILVRVFLVKGQSQAVQKHACKDSCASNIIALGMLDLPKEVKDMLAEEQRLADEFQKKLKEKTKGLSIAELGSAQPGVDAALPIPAGEA